MKPATLPGIALRNFLLRLIWRAILPLLLLAGWLAYDSIRAERTRLDHAAAGLVQNFGTSIDEHLKAHIGALNMLATSPLLDQGERWAEFYREASGFRQSFGSHIIVSDVAEPMQMLLNTRVPYGTPLAKLPRPKGHAAAPAALASGKPAIGDLFFGPIAKERLVAIAVPVLRQDKSALLLINPFPASQLQQRLDQLALPADWAISLRDGQGEVIASRAPAGFDATRDADPDGRYTAASTVSHWTTILEIPRHVRQAHWLSTSAVLIFGLLTATLIGILGGLAASRRLRQAVATLIRGHAATEKPSGIQEIDAAREQLAAAQDKLSHSEERFRRLFNEAPLPLCFVNKHGELVERNRRFDAVFGYTREEIPTLTEWWQLAYPDPDYRKKVLASWNEAVSQAAASGGDIEAREYRVTCRNGEVRDVIISGIAQGEDFLATFFDISERKQSQERLKLWAESFEHAQLGLAISDARSNTFIAVNPAFARERGYHPDELQGKSIHAIFPADLIPTVTPLIETADKTSHSIFESEHLCRDGRRFPVLLDITVLMDAENRPLNRIVYALDLSKRKQVEAALAATQARTIEQQKLARIATLNQMQDANAARAKAEAALSALRESEEKLKLFIEHAPASLAMFDQEMRYIAVSNRWLDDYGIGEDDILGASHYEIFPEIGDDWKAIHRRCLAGEIIRADADRFERQDGTVQWIRWEIRPWFTANGPIAGIVIFSEDITGQKKAEDEIRLLNANLERRVVERTAELSAANTELESFAYAVSHDLRAPLRAMSGFSQALVEDFGSQLVGEARTYLDQISIASRRMGELIDGILALSRSTRGDLRRDLVDISAIATRRLSSLSKDEPQHPVEWQVEPGLVVHGDARMLEAVVENLLDNAWKYTGKTQAPRIRVCAERHDTPHCICVTDNGAGFDMAHAERLFKPFQRLHRQDEFPGIGIGLATVQRIIHRHGGEISARGEPGKGASFCFKLPESTPYTPQE